MNNTVARIVEILFQDVEMTGEAAALRDELMTNCQERFDDLVARGLGEDDAIAAVVESLKGMEDVIGQYPKKAADPFAKQGSAAQASTAGGIDQIELNLKAWDVEIEPSKDGQMHVRCDGEGANRIEVRFEGRRAIITERSQPVEESAFEKRPELKMHWESFTDMFRDIGNFANQTVRRTFSAMGGGTVRIEAPECMDEIVHHSVGGDLNIRGVVLNVLDCGTTSGDVKVACVGEMKHLRAASTSGDVEITGGGFAHTLKVSTTSGDVTVAASAGTAELSTMSGDVDLQAGCERLNVSTLSGDVDVTGVNVRFGEMAVKTVSGEVDVDLTEGEVRTADVKTTSGDVEIVLPRAETSVHTAFKTVSGDLQSTRPDAGNAAKVQIMVQTVSGDVRVS